MKKMLQLSTIKDAWSNVRKTLDTTDTLGFQHRDASKQLATELGFVYTETHANTSSTHLHNIDPTDTNDG